MVAFMAHSIVLGHPTSETWVWIHKWSVATWLMWDIHLFGHIEFHNFCQLYCQFSLSVTFMLQWIPDSSVVANVRAVCGIGSILRLDKHLPFSCYYLWKVICSVLCVTCTNITLKCNSAVCPDYMASWFTSVYCILSASFFPLVYKT